MNLSFDNIKSSLYYNKCIACKSNMNLNECNNCLSLVCVKCDDITTKTKCRMCIFLENTYRVKKK